MSKELINKNDELLEKNGWIKSDMGYNRKKDYNKSYELHIRKRRLKNVLESRKKDNKNDFFDEKKSNRLKTKNQENTVNMGLQRGSDSLVSNPTMGAQKFYLTPTDTLPVLSHFDEFESLKELRNDVKDSLVIAFDTEYSYNNEKQLGIRHMLSYQFACVYDNYLYEFVFTRGNNKEDFIMSAEVCIARILDELGFISIDVRKVRRYKCIIDDTSKKEAVFINKDEAVENSVVKYEDGKVVHIEYDYSDEKDIDVTLLCHAAKFDVTAFSNSYTDKYDIVGSCKDIGGGMVTTYSVKMKANSLKEKYNKNSNIHIYPVCLSVSDTMCHTAKDKSKLEDLGDVVGWPKIKVDSFYKSHMNIFLIEHVDEFYEYASNDCIVALLYAAALYGFNKKLPLTIISQGCNVVTNKLYELLNCKNESEFEYKYRGQKKEKHGKYVDRINGKSIYNDKTCYESINPDAHIIQNFSSFGFRGGYNICLAVGRYNKLTFDYDLKNGYPTVMSLIPDINWANAIKKEIANRELTLDDFVEDGKINLLTMIVAYVTFEFPKNCKFPCIQIQDNGTPVYPLTSKGCEGVYACGPELYLALCLGAKVYVKRGYILNTAVDENGNKSYKLRQVIKQFVKDRSRAKEKYGEDCLEQYILKLLVNSMYGKLSQDVIAKSRWDNYKKSMEDIGCSKITNPVTACFTTALVRSVLIATLTQVYEKGYTSYSVTTDGFISDIPREVLESLDLFSFKQLLESSRLYLTDGKDASFWEIKHVQDDLLNFSTRGNVSLHNKNDNPIIYKEKKYGGVCAHLSMKSGYVSNSVEDRKWLYEKVVTRTSKIEVDEGLYTTLKDMQLGNSKHFMYEIHIEHKSADFDMKRKPVKESMKSVFMKIKCAVYEIVNYTTEPFEDITEFRKYRTTKEKVECLRTKEDFEKFYYKLDTECIKTKNKDMNRDKLMTCIRMHRAGLRIIPALNVLKADARLNWINKHNDSKKLFTTNDWKNAGRNDRFINILPEKIVKDKLEELINDTDIDEYL